MTDCHYALVGLPNRLFIYMLGSLGHLAAAFALLAVEALSGQYSGHLADDHRNDLLANSVLRTSFSTKCGQLGLKSRTQRKEQLLPT